MTATPLMEDLIVSNMTEQLSKYDIRRAEVYPETGPLFRRAAVLMPLTVRDGEIFLLLTQRSKSLRTHPSAVSFPGGIRDNMDKSDIDTALREAEEEIGLPRTSVKVLAVLDRGITLPNTIVYFVVGLIPNDFQPKINPQEVETAFYIPLSEFNSPRVSFHDVKIYGEDFPSATLPYIHGQELFVIYGFTALHSVVLAHIIFEKNTDKIYKSLNGYLDFVSQRVKSKSKSKM